MDDGSTDGSSELSDELANKNNKVITIHQENGGVSKARNTGIEYILANYRELEEKIYVSFLDADDVWSTAFLNKQVNESIMKGFDLIGFQSCLCNSDLSRRSEPISLEVGEYYGGNRALWIHAGQHFGAMFYRADLLSKYNIRFKKIKYSEDKIFQMTCMFLASNIYL